MVFNRKLQSLVVEVLKRRRFVAAQSQTQGAIMDKLHTSNGCGVIAQSPDCVVNWNLNEKFGKSEKEAHFW